MKLPRLVAMTLFFVALLVLEDIVPWGDVGQANPANAEAPAESALNPRGETVRLRMTRDIDGDSLVAMSAAGESVRIRLIGIDSPERAQAHGPEARKALATRLRRAEFEATLVRRDTYGRWLVVARVDGQDVGEWMLRQGHAWLYRRYLQDIPRGLREPYQEAEAEARRAQRGLWALPSPEAPWDFRRRRKDS